MFLRVVYFAPLTVYLLPLAHTIRSVALLVVLNSGEVCLFPRRPEQKFPPSDTIPSTQYVLKKRDR